MNNQQNEIEIIAPDDAAAILQGKLEELQSEGWIVLVRHDYMARLTRQDRNLDLQVDLLGNLSVEEKPLTLAQESGQWVAIVTLLILGLFVLTMLTILDIL